MVGDLETTRFKECVGCYFTWEGVVQVPYINPRSQEDGEQHLTTAHRGARKELSSVEAAGLT